MASYHLACKQLKIAAPILAAGDEVILSGVIYTARDAAHKRLDGMIKSNQKLPFEIDGSIIYYCGPTPSSSRPLGSTGPTTSGRMDRFAPMLYDMGLVATIGKGMRNDTVTEAIARNNALYLCAIGGAGAIASRSIVSSKVIAFDDLGCESIKEIEVVDFSLVVGIDTAGNCVYQ